jgi:hypothetical protein
MGKDHLTDLDIDWRIIFEWFLREIVCDGVDWIHWIRRGFIGGLLQT